MNCSKCGIELSGESGSYEGFCVDCWPEYDCCADSRCNHYRMEHDLLLGEAVYVRPGSEDVAKEFENIHISGCANAGCPCEAFREPLVKRNEAQQPSK